MVKFAWASTSHIGNMTGNAKAAACRLSPLLRRMPRRAGRRQRRERQLARSHVQAARFSTGRSSNADPLQPALCPPIRICLTPSLAASTAPTCRSGTPLPSRNGPTWWPGSSTSLHAGRTKSRELQSIFLLSPKSPPDGSRPGQAFARVECWKCHGVQGMANGPSASTLTDDLGHPDRALQLHRRFPAQVRQYRSGYLQDLHDRPGWHADAFVCG